MVLDTRKKLQGVKKTLKVWETQFVKENNHRPDKEDVRQAPQHIQDAYKEYAALKRQLQESEDQSSPNLGAWGTECNKNNLAESCPTIKMEEAKDVAKHKKSSSAGMSIMGKLGQKLLEKAIQEPKVVPTWGISKSSRGSFGSPAPKSTNVSHQKGSSCASSNNKQLPLINSNSDDCDASLLTDISFSASFSEKENSKDLISCKSLSSSFSSVLDKVSVHSKHKTISQPSINGMDTDVIVPFGLSKSHLAQKNLSSKYKYVDKYSSHVDSEGVECDENKSVDVSRPFVDTCTDSSFNCNNEDEDIFTKSDAQSSGHTSKTSNHSVNMCMQHEKYSGQTTATCQDKQLTMTFNQTDSYEFLEEESSSQVNKSEKPPSKESCKSSQPENMKKRKLSSDISQECDVQAPAKVRKTDEQSGKGRSSKRGSGKKSALDQQEEEEDWENAGMSEVAWQPDKPTVNIETDTAPDTQDDGVSKKVKSKSKTFAAKKNVSNENFVRLNMKVKCYKRKGRFMTGPAYKRMKWKEKMKARSNSYGDKCFKCGGTGHWAKACKGRGASVPELDAGQVQKNTVDDTAFPTLREAMGMSRGTKVKRTETPAKPKKVAPAEAIPEIDDLELELEICRSEYDAPAPPEPVESIYDIDCDGNLPEPTADVRDALKMFGFDDFRPGQQKAIMRILCGESTLVVLSTGSGKSLCYQLPAYLYAKKLNAITLVISPLVSLMEDQVTGLPPGIKGACLHTNMTQAQRKRVIDSVNEGEVHFLLVSPEAMTSSSNAHSLMGTAKLPPIAFACIDEAHCVSEWSHHFRPSYLRICKVLRENYGVKCMLGLTATATMVTAASVAQHLGIDDYRTSTIRDLPVPSNLLLSASRDEDKDQALLALLQGDRFSDCASIIIYCTRREQTNRIATLIRTCLKDTKLQPCPTTDTTANDDGPTKKTKKGKVSKSSKKSSPDGSWSAECYHAGLTPGARRRVQKAFMSGRLRVVVATVAFGMGVDKSDVRGIIHYTMPKSYESYVQEIGRAGRDGKPSHCHVFLDYQGSDSNELKRHIYANTIDRYIIKKFVKKVFPPCHCREKYETLQDFADEDDITDNSDKTTKRVCPGHERAIPIDKTVQDFDIKEEGISTLMCYLELHPKNWLINLQSVYSLCSIQCYGGPKQLQEIAAKCPPVAVAIAKQRKKGASFASSNSVEFSVIEISDAMGWESGPVKRELKMLQWSVNQAGVPRKTGVLVTFSELAFHLRSPGDLSEDDVEEIVSFLDDRIQTQERTEIAQLHRLQSTLQSASHKDIWMCADSLDVPRSDKLKTALREYFDEQPHLEDGHVTMLSFAREYGSQKDPSVLEKIHCENEDQVRSDVRSFVYLYNSEHSLSGRVIARIFHGIGSPCFPPEIWGRVRRYWRCHLCVDFNMVRRIATQQLIKIR